MAAALALEPLRLRGRQGAKREPLIVGGLPVTCNLTLPVACAAKAASIKAGTATNDFEFEYSKYSGWPEIKESLMAGPHPGGLHAGAAGHGSGRQEDPGEDRVARVIARAR